MRMRDGGEEGDRDREGGNHITCMRHKHIERERKRESGHSRSLLWPFSFLQLILFLRIGKQVETDLFTFLTDTLLASWARGKSGLRRPFPPISFFELGRRGYPDTRAT
ncbi:hypothetical protein LX36DRAFT_61368 [Colletotrichum falcatum]|nr:hypothetical protein LX36DRAFT_61368 [Colletotrichum falcatum]